MEKMEKLLNIWIEDLHQRNCPCSLMAIQTKALTLLEDLKEKEGPSAESETFTAIGVGLNVSRNVLNYITYG
ncbi:hypothetical protein M514_27488 [Trichuris suis]|uniref:HTH CENPB-type domain-containing protein n=1 Tax=Trichuris suis TaxID=68888 RepID=A0A085MSZ4_9BILA|nr:hypothetical protein M514_27488 [Trichuris suis]